ncbi:LOW QUALITY PROTEIN: ATP-dependent RNA helicase Prp43 [Phytophthora palmivora]|uniref:ATP-dependent RNA helicase Prp43 n=1 Tax=Phytophthora palmivora TaxID=4796 RepID=A0A2P4Y706_9STRA|nr:LOW QUALITY PROTEIN: ATP-dependent RNA helicase Prp43 [Phytophthora palmivora]
MSTRPGSIGAAKSLGLAGPHSPTELCNVPTSVRAWDTREDRQDAYTPEEVLGVAGPREGVAMSLATVYEAKAHCQACGIATTASPNAESRRAVQASTVAAGNIGPQAAEAAEESAKDISSVGNLGPHSETPPARQVEEQYHVFEVMSGRQLKAGAVHLDALPEVSAPGDEHPERDALGVASDGTRAFECPSDVQSLGRLLRPFYAFAQTYFDDIFVYSRAEDGPTTLAVHLKHLRRVFEVLIANQR